MKKTHILAVGILTGAMFTGGLTFARQATEFIEVTYDNIRILIDGIEYNAKDATGATVEPFIYNGTTYLPVRAIASAFDKEVDWEPQTSTVTLGSKNYDWLDQMGFADYYSSTPIDKMLVISEDTTMSDKEKYDRGLKFYLKDYPPGSEKNSGTIELSDGSIECAQYVSYLLNNNYNEFVGKISADKTSNRDRSAVIKFYGDGQLIYTSPVLSYGTKTTDFKVSVDGIKVLKIRAEIINPLGKSADVTPCIIDARLSKK